MSTITFTVRHIDEQWLSEPCPEAGGGVNHWLLKIARRCAMLNRSEAEAEDRIRNGSADCGRPVTEKEIRRALWRAYNTATSRSDERKEPKIAVNQALAESITKDGPGVCDLAEISPVRFRGRARGTIDVVTTLFAGDPLVCVGIDKRSMDTMKLHSAVEIISASNDLRYIVPNAMSKKRGINLDGKESSRCLDNTGPRMYFVADFDQGNKDSHAALIAHLANYAPLAVVMDSGGKSLHGWFRTGGSSEELVSNLINYAISLGADPQMRVLCQFCRMPDATRENGNRQSVIYFNPRNAVL
jgi:hypothetical protein